MKQINSLPLSSLLVASHYEYHATVVKYIIAATPVALHVETQFPHYQTSVQTQFATINQNQNLIGTDELADLDHQRDQLLSRLNSQIDMAARSPLADEKEAGEKLKKIVSPYRGIAGNEYTKETAQVRGLLRDLGEDAVAPFVDTLSLGRVIQSLRQTNNAFAAKMDERVAGEATRAAALSGTTARQQRIVIDQQYNEIIQIVNAFAIALPTDEITAFVDQMNALVEQYKRVIASQRPGGTGNEDRKSKEEPGEEEQQPAV